MTHEESIQEMNDTAVEMVDLIRFITGEDISTKYIDFLRMVSPMDPNTHVISEDIYLKDQISIVVEDGYIYVKSGDSSYCIPDNIMYDVFSFITDQMINRVSRFRQDKYNEDHERKKLVELLDKYGFPKEYKK